MAGYQSFAAWLRAQRAIKRLSQTGACKGLEVSRATLSAWENGSLLPAQVDHVAKLAEWGGCEPQELFDIIMRDRGSPAA